MADQKISELTALTGANVADDDAIAIVDTSATETKKIVFSELKNALDTATGFVRITGDTMTGALDVQSTITSDGLTVDTDTLHVDATNNRVGIGTSSPSKKLHLAAADVSMYLDNTNANGQAWEFKSTNGASASTGALQLKDEDGHFWMAFNENAGSNYTQFLTNNAERMRIDSSGHAIIPAGVTLGTSAGTYAAANTLDDYEEGTWTPTIQGSATAGTYTPSTAVGKYTKVGRAVHLEFYIQNFSTASGGSGYMRIEGLPFAKVTLHPLMDLLGLMPKTVRMMQTHTTTPLVL